MVTSPRLRFVNNVVSLPLALPLATICPEIEYSDISTIACTRNGNLSIISQNQNRICSDLGNAIPHSFCFGINVNPTESSRCYIRVLISSFSGIDTDIIGDIQLNFNVTVRPDVSVRNCRMTGGSLSIAFECQSAILVGYCWLSTFLLSGRSCAPSAFLYKQEAFPTICCFIFVNGTLWDI